MNFLDELWPAEISVRFICVDVILSISFGCVGVYRDFEAWVASDVRHLGWVFIFVAMRKESSLINVEKTMGLE